MGRGYALAMALRREGYSTGRLHSYRPKVPVLSVGNIAMGGTGKTPVTSWLLDWARAKGKKACVLSRGYGGNPGHEPLLVSADTPVALCGDEPLLLARTHPQARVVVFPRRVASARLAEAELAPDLFLLDDGMQHLALARDVNLVLLRPEDFSDAEWGKVVPHGFWREGVEALASASAFLVKTPPGLLAGLAAEKRLAPYGRPLFSFSLEPCGAVPVLPAMQDGSGHCRSWQGLAAKDLPGGLGAEYSLITGVGNPAQVLQTVTDFMQRPPLCHLAFADHHPFSGAEVATFRREGRLVICTEKDAVKLAPFLDPSESGFFALRVRASFGPALFTSLSFEDWLETTGILQGEGSIGSDR